MKMKWYLCKYADNAASVDITGNNQETSVDITSDRCQMLHSQMNAHQ